MRRAGRPGDDDGLEPEEEEGGGFADTCRGCLVDQRAQPPCSPPRVAPIQGVPTPSRPFPRRFGGGIRVIGSEGGVEDLLHATSKGNLTPR